MKKGMKKKIIALALVAALGASAAIGGSLAFFTDTDEATNTMTYGGVSIKQHEYQRQVDENGKYVTGTVDSQESYLLENFEDDKPILPIVGDPNEPGNSPAYAGWDTTTVRMSQVESSGGMTVFAGKNAVDKFVTVENTGKSDAYVRTLVAIEVGSGNKELIKTSHHKNWTVTNIGTIVIKNNNYNLYEYVYAGAKNDDGTWYKHANGVLPAGETTYNSLAQVYLKSKATNEDVLALDGDKDGKLSVLVFPQAVQAAGFDDAKTALDTAFGGPISASNHPWMD